MGIRRHGDVWRGVTCGGTKTDCIGTCVSLMMNDNGEIKSPKAYIDSTDRIDDRVKNNT